MEKADKMRVQKIVWKLPEADNFERSSIPCVIFQKIVVFVSPAAMNSLLDTQQLKQCKEGRI